MLKSLQQLLRESVDITTNPNFWNWFTDSKVVDENGKPQVVYHGSRSPWIGSFDLGMEGTGVVMNNSNSKLGGVWFTTSRENAEFYADERDKPRASEEEDDIQAYGFKDKWYAAIPTESNYDEDEDEYSDNEIIFTVGPFKTPDEAEKDGLRQAILYNKKLDHNTFVLEVYLRITNPLIINGIVPRQKEFEAARSGGYDGIIAMDVLDGQYHGDIMVVFSPYQIKSTDNNGDFSTETSDIRR